MVGAVSLGEEPFEAGDLAFGQPGGSRDLAAVQPQAATTRAQIHLETLEGRAIEHRGALDTSEVRRFRHAVILTSTSPPRERRGPTRGVRMLTLYG